MDKPGPIAVTVIGTDRPGIVAGVTRSLYEAGCNLEDVTSTILRGHFSMVMVVRGPEGVDAASLEEALAPASRDLDLVVAARPVEEADASLEPSTHVVSVYGADHPGIVHGVASLLADRSVNIVDLTTRMVGTAESPVYTMVLEVTLPSGANPQEFEHALAEKAAELGVTCRLHPSEADIL